jgi:hypothetical protein
MPLTVGSSQSFSEKAKPSVKGQVRERRRGSVVEDE